MLRRKFLTAFALLLVSPIAVYAQGPQGNKQARPSPPEQAAVVLNGKQLTVDYGAPSMRGRKIMGELVPYGEVWRTGANEATTLKTQSSLRIRDLIVPAGTYTLYTIPSDQGWTLIVNRQTGQWGTVYNKTMDLGRVKMSEGVVPSNPQERFEIRFEHTSTDSTEMHLLWENTDVYVPIRAID